MKTAGIVSVVKQALLQLFVTVVVCLIPVPIFAILLVPSLLHRAVAILLARLFRPDLSHIFGGKGSCFALESIHTKPKLNILLHFIFDGPFDLNTFRAHFDRVIINEVDKDGNLRYAHLRQYWTQFAGFLFWKWDADFHLSNHIRLIVELEDVSLPSKCTEDDLKSATSHLLSRPFAAGRSPWEAFVVPNYRSSDNQDGREQTAIVFRVHHALADGYSILGMWLKLSPQNEHVPVPKSRSIGLSSTQKMCQSVAGIVKLPWDVAGLVINSYDPESDWRLGTKLERKHYTFFSDRILVEDIKRIKRKFGVSYNAAVYAVTAGGIRKLMREAGLRAPEMVSCFLPFPLPRHPGGLAFHASGFYFKFSPTLTHPVERLREIAHNINKVTSSATAPLALGLLGDIIGMMPVWVAKAVANKMRVTMSMTSFPGPEGEPNLVDSAARMVDIMPALGHPAGQLGATAVLVSIAGKQRIALTVDRKIFSNSRIPQNFAQYLNEEVSALLNSPAPEVDAAAGLI